MELKHCYTKKEIYNQLEQMHAPKDSIVLMHSSLRAVGAVEDGAQGLLDVMIDYFTQDGGLFCVPVHTWHNIGRDITLDMSSSDNALGAFSTVAAEDKRGLRTENPIHSLMVFGDRAKAAAFAANEPDLKSPTAPESCHGKMYSEGGHILLVGVAQNRNTYLHSVAEILGLPDRMADTPLKCSVKKTTGEIIRREMTLYHTSFCGDISTRFIQYDTAFRYHRCITDGFIGNAPTQLCDARKLKETVELIFKNSGGVDPLSNEAPIPQTWYIKR